MTDPTPDTMTPEDARHAEDALLAFADLSDEPAVTIWQCQAVALAKRLRLAEAERDALRKAVGP